MHLKDSITELIWLNLPKNINGVESYTFSDCKNLMIVNFPTSLKYIGNSAFNGCVNMTAMSSTAKEPAPIFANGFGGIDHYK